MPQPHLRAEEIEAVTHYLGSLKPAKKTPKAFRFVNAERGMSLYHEFGCVACHEPSPDFHPAGGQPDESEFTYPHIPLTNLSKKYDFDSLSAFLYTPHNFWPQSRMPKFKLDKEDGGDLTAFLLDHQNGDSTEYPSIAKFQTHEDLAEIGGEIVELRNCSSCHDSLNKEERRTNKLLPINKHFSDISQSDDHPSYNLSENQIQSIDEFLNAAISQAPVLTSLQTLNCLACHDRNGIGGPDLARKVYFAGDHDLGDVGRYPPPLTDIGRKLQPKWLNEALIGNKTVRAYLKTQMPDFGESVTTLSRELSNEDKISDEPKLRSGYKEVGRKLLGTQGGLNCISCHDWGDRISLGIRALNLDNINERLQPGWFYEYLIDPSSYRTNTLMPSFWPNGEASNNEVLGGNTLAQISAIYSFANNGKGIPEGFHNENSTQFEIKPIEQPVIQRTFLQDVGTHAILVGFPDGIHLAIDGKSGQPAEMWKGRFFDAYNTWFSRFPEFGKPQGHDLAKWPASSRKPLSQFQGYRLDKEGIPEFILKFKEAELIERFTPHKLDSGETGMLRVVHYSRLGQLDDKRLNHPRKIKRTEINDNDPMTRTFIYQW